MNEFRPYDYHENRDAQGNVPPQRTYPAQEERREYSDYYYKKMEKKERSRGRKNLVLVALICSLLGGFVGGSTTYLAMNKTQGNKGAATTSSSAGVTINTTDEMGVVQAVAHKALPSVVGITTQSVRQSWFGPVAVSGAGSGFIVNKDGYIVTNSHVVDGGSANEVNVILNDGTQEKGQVLWADGSLDLAVVKIKGSPKLVPAELGDSSKLQIGEPAIAIGNPLGMDFQRSVTSGVISGLDRTIGEVRSQGGGQSNYMDGLIQTDASINQGNSGGPLLNKEGQVIGINTVKISSAEGLGFSIPINTVKPIVEQVIQTGTYKTVSLGIVGKDITAILQANDINLGVDHGVYIYQVVPGSSAESAGIAAGDIITKVGDKDIQGMGELKKMLYQFKKGDTVTFTVFRNGKEQNLEVTFKNVVADNKVKDKKQQQPQQPQNQGQWPQLFPEIGN